MSRHITVEIDGARFDQWTEGEVTRNLKDFAGTFSFTCRDGDRSRATFPYSSIAMAARLRPGSRVVIQADGTKILDGWLKTVEPNIDEGNAEVVISGEDKAGDLVDSSAAVDGPGEWRNLKLEDAARKIAEPFGLKVQADIDTGAPFPRYPIDLGETGLAAIEKGARQRHALVTSDGVGGVVITRAGKRRAAADLTLPGNVLGSRGNFTHQGRHSETIVRAQAEKAEGRRDGRAAPLSPSSVPTPVEDRQNGEGEGTERERRGTALTGRARDDEIRRHRPIVHLGRTQADEQSAKDEADWRMRTARAESEEINYRVAGVSAGGRVWRVNEMTYVSDAFQGIERDMLISAVTYRENEDGAETELTVSSPEAFSKGPAGSARRNRKSKSAGTSSGGLDGTAEAL